jgi:hypothetical protein
MNSKLRISLRVRKQIRVRVRSMCTMTAIRRHVFALALATMTLQVAAVAGGSLRVCLGTAHTHAGVAAPDGSMHHQTGSQEAQHVHHGHAAPSDVAGDSGQRLTCRCSNDVTAINLGPAAILRVAARWSPFVAAVMLAVPSDPSIADIHFSPPSPPPR